MDNLPHLQERRDRGLTPGPGLGPDLGPGADPPGTRGPTHQMLGKVLVEGVGEAKEARVAGEARGEVRVAILAAKEVVRLARKLVSLSLVFGHQSL